MQNLKIYEVKIVKEGEKDGKKWTKYAVSTDQGEYSAFQSKWNDIAKAVGETISADVLTSKYGRNIGRFTIIKATDPIQEQLDRIEDTINEIYNLLKK